MFEAGAEAAKKASDGELALTLVGTKAMNNMRILMLACICGFRGLRLFCLGNQPALQVLLHLPNASHLLMHSPTHNLTHTLTCLTGLPHREPQVLLHLAPQEVGGAAGPR